MSDLQVIYDAQREIAAIVDLDTQLAWGPSMIGPDAAEDLEAWLQTLPYDVDGVTSETGRAWFVQFLSQVMRAEEARTDEPDSSEVVSGPGDTVAAESLALQEARQQAGEPPDPAPYDTDTTATEPINMVLVNCPVCNGDKVVSLGDPPQAMPCGFCNQTGKIERAAA